MAVAVVDMGHGSCLSAFSPASYPSGRPRAACNGGICRCAVYWEFMLVYVTDEPVKVSIALALHCVFSYWKTKMYNYQMKKKGIAVRLIFVFVLDANTSKLNKGAFILVELLLYPLLSLKKSQSKPCVLATLFSFKLWVSKLLCFAPSLFSQSAMDIQACRLTHTGKTKQKQKYVFDS